MAGRRTDIGSGRVYCDPKPDPITIGFGCLKTDPTRKNQVRNRVGFPSLGLDFFFFFFFLITATAY